jgi:hypothetical protein
LSFTLVVQTHLMRRGMFRCRLGMDASLYIRDLAVLFQGLSPRSLLWSSVLDNDFFFFGIDDGKEHGPDFLNECFRSG